MRRDYFESNVRNVDDEQALPVVEISFDGPSGELADRLVTDDGTLDADGIDVTYRLQTAIDAADASGVLSVANRLTGEFVLETGVDPDAIRSLIRAVKQADGEEENRYRVRITDGQGKSTLYDKETLLVYDADGSLLRRRSLIPGGVEL